MSDPKLHRRPGTVVHFDPDQWKGQPRISTTTVVVRSPRKVFTRSVYADGSTTRGDWWLRDWDRHVAAAARFPNARIEVPNG